ncbi:Phenazine biosynthesis PhzC/PhzF protein [Paraburkholderia piptadeniae]|uniref:PhzF family phenazine biosynthesis isomerase n=2 Tax=Paraburkholderia TaxID=1822464 RepID=A0A7X1NC18_9BURK|nr:MULTISPECIES: PhzF family phenazine biosynthesis protein [Paraburkholderia]MPW18713.1 PhzF family phenazine biosynthesis isomerase [Paraburkholderia franconis]SIT48357.1 Phenazine biosynthesis PhzC/PhzF protein [Paraburkholderia piptadeniae]
MKLFYKVVDVFTFRRFFGNPVAVLLNAEGLAADEMQRIANWTNLSETTFVLPPETAEADYTLRIFSPRSELAFAGHPTLGSAHAILEAGLATSRPGGRLIQQCDAGLIQLSVGKREAVPELYFSLPPAQFQPLGEADLTELALILGRKVEIESAPAIVNVGLNWIVAQLNDATSVIDLRPDFARLAALERRLGVAGLTVFGTHKHGEAAIEVRAFAPSSGVLEDPVCGSGNGSVAAFQWERGLLPSEGVDYVAAQGRCVGRDGRVRVSVDVRGNIRVGGACVTCLDGWLMR